MSRVRLSSVGVGEGDRDQRSRSNSYGRFLRARMVRSSSARENLSRILRAHGQSVEFVLDLAAARLPPSINSAIDEILADIFLRRINRARSSLTCAMRKTHPSTRTASAPRTTKMIARMDMERPLE